MQPELSRLLDGDDAAFVDSAYATILERAPEEEEKAKALSRLTHLETSRIELLGQLRYCAEGKARGVSIPGLLPLYLGKRLLAVPVLGYWLQLLLALSRLPRTTAELRRTQLLLANNNRQLAEQLRMLADELGKQMPMIAAHIAGMPRADQLTQALESRADKGEVERLGHQLSELQHELTAHAHQLADHGRGVQALGHALPSREPLGSSETAPGFDLLYAEFEDLFRGSREEITRRLEVYLADVERALATAGPGILDLGCGRGEWLQLLGSRGITAHGVDANTEMIARCRAQGLEVTQADVLAHLHQLPASSLGVITGFHLVEHLSLEYLIELLDQSSRVLRPGGLIVLETPNPENLIVGACSFYTDPSHLRPLVPNALQFLVQRSGFAEVEVRRLHKYSDFYDVSTQDQFVKTWFHSEMDFAIVGVKA